MRRGWVVAALLVAAGCPPAGGAAPVGLYFRLNGDRLDLRAQRAPLGEILQEFARAGVRVRFDPRVKASVSGILAGEDLQRALDSLLGPFDYALIWDVIPGPLGTLPKLSEIHVFQRDRARALETLPDPNRRLEVTSGSNPNGPPYVKDELLIGMKPGTTAEEFLRLVNQIGGMVVGSVPELGIYQIRFPPNTNIDGLVQQLRQNPAVAEVEPNYVVQMPPAAAAAAASAASAPPSGRRDGALPVAILDSGLSAQAGLQDWVVGSYDALRPDQALDDTAGHGTQMALIASGAVLPDGADGGEGLPLVAVRAFDDNGNASSYSLMRGLQYALAQGARVINMSWGTATESAFLAAAVRYAQSRGAVLVAAAGNEPTGRAVYPAACDGVVAVSALDAGGQAWERSNYGDFVTAAAPGTATFSVGYQGPAGGYAGTSIASAYVARALARYWSRHPDATARQVTDAFRAALTDAGTRGRDAHYGYGALDTAALRAFLQD